MDLPLFYLTIHEDLLQHLYPAKRLDQSFHIVPVNVRLNWHMKDIRKRFLIPAVQIFN